MEFAPYVSIIIAAVAAFSGWLLTRTNLAKERTALEADMRQLLKDQNDEVSKMLKACKETNTEMMARIQKLEKQVRRRG